MNIPRVVVAGTGSGVGKTSFSVGLVAALGRRGWVVQTFKVGPDYLDPTYLAAVSGRPCCNLDGWMMGEAYVRRQFERACRGADAAVIEGVMGLFDGADPEGLEGSTAEVAAWLDAPVLLVAGARGVGRSFAATVHGFISFEKEVRIAGVVANGAGSEKHSEGLARSLSAAGLPPLLGAVQRGDFPELPSRHLGLKSADGAHFSESVKGLFATVVETGVDVGKIEKLMGEKKECVAVSSSQHSGRWQCSLGVARDEAFQFYYPDNLEALREAGCRLVEFSPLRDRTLPAGLDGLYFGGGYPEAHAAALASNKEMSKAVRGFACGGGAVYAECGGLMFLSEGIELMDGTRHEMVGILPAWTKMLERRKMLGYVAAALRGACLWGEAGTVLRGHEFHYSCLECEPEGWERSYELRYVRTGETRLEGFQSGRVLASYVHLHFASCAGVAENFVERLKA